MNPVAIMQLCVAVVIVTAAVPLIQRKVKMNPWYGVRIPAAFTSDDAWFEINHYGGRLLALWGVGLAATAIMGLFVAEKNWGTYNGIALAVVLGGLAAVIAKILLHARKIT